MSRSRVLVTGDRNWEGREAAIAIQTVLTGLDLAPDYDTIIHGDARGVDRMAGTQAEALRLRVEAYPADWKTHGKAAGPIRNQWMLDTGVDICWAFHDDIASSTGTADMVRRCVKRGIPTFVVARARGVQVHPNQEEQ